MHHSPFLAKLKRGCLIKSLQSFWSGTFFLNDRSTISGLFRIDLHLLIPDCNQLALVGPAFLPLRVTRLGTVRPPR